jgi:hypothetical protein
MSSKKACPALGNVTISWVSPALSNAAWARREWRPSILPLALDAKHSGVPGAGEVSTGRQQAVERAAAASQGSPEASDVRTRRH